MGFSYEVTQRLFMENKRFHIGTYASADGSEGGAITVGMSKVDALILIPYGTSVTSQPVINATFPADDGIAIVTAANESGLFIAIGV